MKVPRNPQMANQMNQVMGKSPTVNGPRFCRFELLFSVPESHLLRIDLTSIGRDR